MLDSAIILPRVEAVAKTLPGKLKDILDDIVEMDADALDPIEPLPQGDVELIYVRENYEKKYGALRKSRMLRH